METETPRKALVWRIFENPWAPMAPLFVGAIIVFVVILLPWRPSKMTPAIQARDAAAMERAQAWLEALGFEPGPVVCRTLRTGSGWCTARAAGTDKTFSLFCSFRHPTCIENIATFKW